MWPRLLSPVGRPSSVGMRSVYFRCNSSRATFLNYNLKLKEDAKKAKMGLPSREPEDLPDFIPEPFRLSQDQDKLGSKKGMSSTYAALNVAADQIVAKEEADDDAELLEGLEHEDSVDEEDSAGFVRNETRATDEEMERAAEAYLEDHQGEEDSFLAKLDAEVEADNEEDNSDEHQIHKFIRGYEKEAKHFAKTEFRDTDKVILKIMKVHQREPLKLWK